MTRFPDDALVRITFDSRGLVEAAGRTIELMREAGAAALRANETIAKRMQEAQLKFLRDSIESTGRPQRETQYLVRALESPAFVEYDEDHFTVGTEQVLDDPQISPYWRGLEYGSAAHVGQTLYGYFRSAEGKKYPAMADRFRQDPRLIQVTQDAPVGKSRRGRGFAFPITIHHEIPNYEFLAKGRDEVVADIDQIYRDFIPGLR